jgi:tRNA (mo5U34)-methyltransferase
MLNVVQEIDALGPWFHNLHLPDGAQTCGDHRLGDFPNVKWQKLAPHLPADLHGATVLDIGCNAGFYSFELAKRGAEVTAIDSDEHYLRQARWAARAYGLDERVKFLKHQLYDLGAVERTWDIVLFLGVLYHLRYPLLGLDIVSRCVGTTLVIQSLTAPGELGPPPPADFELADRAPLVGPSWPRLSFIERNFAGDPSNWWVPNAACLAAMVRSAGLRVISAPLDEFLLCSPDREGETSMWRWNEEEYWAAVGPRGPDL